MIERQTLTNRQTENTQRWKATETLIQTKYTDRHRQADNQTERHTDRQPHRHRYTDG